MVVYLAGISGIDQSLYEAAIIDGATKLQQVKHVTLPMQANNDHYVYSVCRRIFSTDFGLFYNIPRNSGAIIDVTQTIDVYVQGSYEYE